MDQKNIGQVSGVNDRERQDFSGLNSSSVEQAPDGVGQMSSGDFGAEQAPTGMTQDEAVARLNQMFEAQGIPGLNGFDTKQMAMGQMAMRAQSEQMAGQMQPEQAVNQTQFNQIRQEQLIDRMQPEQVANQPLVEQIPQERLQGFESVNSQIEQEKNLETERAEVERGEEYSDEGVPKSDLGKIVTVGTRTFEDGKLIGTDLPKARDRDGLEEEILKEVEKTKKIKSPTMQYRQKRMLSANFINDRYGRILGQEN